MPAQNSSDDSDAEEDAIMQRLREATDQTLLTNAMFQEKPATDSQQFTKEPQTSTVARKSQRYIDVDDRLENDMQVTDSMQSFMHKKLNQIIEKRVEFVEVVAPVQPDDEEEFESAVQLFRDSKPIVLVADVPETNAEQPKQKRPKKHKRRAVQDDEVTKESDRIAAAVVSVDDIQKEVSTWAEKRVKPNKHFEYVEHKTNKVLYLTEPDTEFTKMRKKNNWSENKIARK